MEYKGKKGGKQQSNKFIQVWEAEVLLNLERSSALHFIDSE